MAVGEHMMYTCCCGTVIEYEGHASYFERAYLNVIKDHIAVCKGFPPPPPAPLPQPIQPTPWFPSTPWIVTAGDAGHGGGGGAIGSYMGNPGGGGGGGRGPQQKEGGE